MSFEEPDFDFALFWDQRSIFVNDDETSLVFVLGGEREVAVAVWVLKPQKYRLSRVCIRFLQWLHCQVTCQTED